jgi:hypothetical protein
MLIGIVSVVIGVLVLLNYSTLLGGFFLVVGVAIVGRQYVTEEKGEYQPRDYQSGATTYDISSKSKR